MNSHEPVCPNDDCPARGRMGEGNITIHARTPLRYRCTVCGKTFGARVGTPFYRRHTDAATITLVLTLLAHGCPLPAVVIAFGVQRQTVRDWLDAAGQQCAAVHRQLVCQPRDLSHVQADELRVKRQGGIVWMAMALMVPTRLWLGGVVSARRDSALIRRLMLLVHAAARPGPILLCVDGFAAYIKEFLAITRTPEARDGRRGRCRMLPWAGVVIGQVVKRRTAGRVVAVTQRLAHGTAAGLARLLPTGQQINTAYIERLNATFRARLGTLTRRTRGLARRTLRLHRGMYLIGTLYNFCTPHASLHTGGPDTRDGGGDYRSRLDGQRGAALSGPAATVDTATATRQAIKGDATTDCAVDFATTVMHTPTGELDYSICRKQGKHLHL